MTTLTIELPEPLAKEAADAGLLAPRALEAMLRERLRRRAIDDTLAAADLPPMTIEEIQEEVNAVRARSARRKPRATGA